MPKVWTVGTGRRSLEEFLRLLQKYGIEAVVDVRRFPTSKLEHFKKENLEQSLKEVGIEYFHVQELGGYRKGGYRKHMESEEFRRGLEFVERLASERRVAIMCAEVLYFRCHRLLISHALKARGNEVVHIIDERRSYEHKTLGDFA